MADVCIAAVLAHSGKYILLYYYILQSPSLFMYTCRNYYVVKLQGLGAAPSRGHEHMPTLTLREKEIARREKAARAENSVLQVVPFEYTHRHPVLLLSLLPCNYLV